MKKVLIVDDSLFIRQFIKNILTNTNKYQIVGEDATGNHALELSRDLNPDVIAMDNVFPNVLGVDIVKELRKEQLPAKIMMMSACNEDNLIQEYINSGANDCLLKPFSKQNLIECMDKLMFGTN